jgi:CubicO group peptidase (beta-lactamase class C family)
MRIPLLTFGALLLGLVSGNQACGQRLNAAEVDRLVNDALKAWKVPGLAIAMVNEDRVVYLKGFGLRTVGRKEPVTPDTVFPLASCTKGFTTTALAQLVDDGRLSWDDPVRKHLPWFRLADPLADANVTIRDLVTHRTGVAGHDLLWYRAPWPPDEAVRRIANVPVQSFRARFQYQSTMFTATGLAAGQAAQSSWRDLVQKRLLTPLEMTATTFTTPEALQAADHARPHRLDSAGKPTAIDWYPQPTPDAAGSLNTTARDLAKWVRFQLGDGTWHDRRLVSAANLAETHRPQIPLRLEGLNRAMNPLALQMSYGMGWVIHDYRGHLIVGHAGAIDGFRAHIMLVPGAGLGIALLCNLHGSRINLALSYTLLDLLLGLPYKDWNAYYGDLVKEEQATAQKAREDRTAARKPDTRPTHERKAYAGTYENAAYGPCRITLEKDALVWHWGRFHASLDHYHFDTFTLGKVEPFALEFPEEPQLFFQLGPDGGVTGLKLLEVEFRRVGGKGG